MQPLYTQLTYEQYKDFEEQLRCFQELETTHESANMDEKYYHKAFRIRIGDFTLEVTGPLIKGWERRE